MKSKIGWILAFFFGGLLLLSAAGMLAFGRAWMWGSHAMMGGFQPEGFQPGGFYPMHMIGRGGILFTCLIGLGVLVLLVVGIVALVNALNKPGAPPAQQSIASATDVESTCPNCGKPVQPDWSTCPYCAHPLIS